MTKLSDLRRTTIIEEWRPVNGFCGSYEVSNKGRVRGVDREIANVNGVTRKWTGRVLKPNVDHDGYLWVHLKLDGTRVRKSVHSLVLESFVGPRPAGLDVAHADGNPRNNELSNLRYCTRSENMMDLVSSGGHIKMQRDKCPQGHLLEQPNIPKAKLAKGHRSCLACERARGYLQRRKPYAKELLQAVSDEYYKTIMEEK